MRNPDSKIRDYREICFRNYAQLVAPFQLLYSKYRRHVFQVKHCSNIKHFEPHPSETDFRLRTGTAVLLGRRSYGYRYTECEDGCIYTLTR